MTTAIKPVESNRTYTIEEFDAIYGESESYELLRGEVYEKAAPGDEHGWICRIILKYVTLYDPEDKYGAMWPSTSVVLSRGYKPIPDLAYVVASRIKKPRSKKAIDLVPDLVVEVHSPSDLASTPDRDAAQYKIMAYQIAGVKIVWAINPLEKTVEVYHPNQLGPVSKLDINDELDGEGVIPGFTLKIKKLFE